MVQKYGRFSWQCRHCHKVITKDTPQGLGLAKSNHMRGHQKKWFKESQEALHKKQAEDGEMTHICTRDCPESREIGCCRIRDVENIGKEISFRCNLEHLAHYRPLRDGE